MGTANFGSGIPALTATEERPSGVGWGTPLTTPSTSAVSTGRRQPPPEPMPPAPTQGSPLRRPPGRRVAPPPREPSPRSPGTHIESRARDLDAR